MKTIYVSYQFGVDKRQDNFGCGEIAIEGGIASFEHIKAAIDLIRRDLIAREPSFEGREINIIILFWREYDKE